MKMQNAKRGGLAEKAQPVGGHELFFARSQLQGIRAVHAMQRAAVRAVAQCSGPKRLVGEKAKWLS